MHLPLKTEENNLKIYYKLIIIWGYPMPMVIWLVAEHWDNTLRDLKNKQTTTKKLSLMEIIAIKFHHLLSLFNNILVRDVVLTALLWFYVHFYPACYIGGNIEMH